MKSSVNPVILIILDGFGIAPPGKGNAISQAHKPTIDFFQQNFPYAQLEASSTYVGLPQGVPGNTEVGHLTIGAGRVVMQDLLRINTDIENEAFFKNPAFLEAIKHAESTGGNLHLMGLIGQGFVHSSTEHLLALLKLCKMNNFQRVYLHLFTDGRDSHPTSGIETVKKIVAFIHENEIGTIATISGRYYAMDRDNRWDRTQKAFEAMVTGEGEIRDNPVTAMQQSYDNNVTDEFVIPTIITNDGKKPPVITTQDSVIFFNFRKDRARQMTKLLVEKLPGLFYVSMTDYESGVDVSAIAYPTTSQKNTLPEVVSQQGLKQARIAESEKRRFVTYYVNGLRVEPFPLEEDIIVPSPKVATYDLQPEMSAPEVTEKIIECITSEEYPFIFVNYANPDMVGHTGKLPETIKAIETIDACLKKIYETVQNTNWTMIITADHGNAELKLTENGEVSTEHTSNLVPIMIINKQYQGKTIQPPADTPLGLSDIAPTVLSLMNVPIPQEMTGRDIQQYVS